MAGQPGCRTGGGLRLRSLGLRAAVRKVFQELAPSAGLCAGRPPPARPQGHRRRLDRHSQPLARPDGHLGHAVGQGCLRGEALQPQRAGGPRDDAVGAEARTHVSDGRAEPQHDRHAADARLHEEREDRRHQSRKGHLLPQPSEHRAGRYARPDSARPRLRSLGGTGSSRAAHPQEAPLRLALEPCHRQRRPRQPKPARTRQGPLGPRQAGTAEAGRERRWSARLHRQRRHRQQPGDDLSSGTTPC
jgi:hypothetical protein